MGRNANVHGTRVDYRERTKLIERLYIKGMGAREIHEFLQIKWPVSLRTVQNNITKIRQKWSERFQELEEYGSFSGEYLARSMELYMKSCDAGDFRGAYAILKDLSLLMGVDLRQPSISIDPLNIQRADHEALDAIEAVLEEAIRTADADHRG